MTAVRLAGPVESDAAPRGARVDSPVGSAMDAKERACVDWGRVYAEAVAALRPVVRLDLLNEVAQEGVARVFLGEAPERQEAESLPAHVVRSGLWAWRTAERAGRWRRSPGVSATIAKATCVPVPAAEEVLSVREERARRFGRLVEAIGDDREVAELVRWVREGVASEAEQAAKLGTTVDAVRVVRKRLKRHIDAVNAQDSDAAREAEAARTISAHTPKVRQS